jgi:hypothetical protein
LRLWLNVYVAEKFLGLSHIMHKKDDFGSLVEKDFRVGDIVEWSTFNATESEWTIHYGIITTICKEIESERLVSVSKVLPLNGPQIEIKFFTASLRLVSERKEPQEINEF